MLEVPKNRMPDREMLPQAAYQIITDEVMLDGNEYPQTAEIEARCVRMLADLWHAPHAAATVGTSTTGSSEGCMLGGLAMKRRWPHSRR